MFRWLILTFTMEHTVVIDIFAGFGGLGVVYEERHRHYLCVDYDRPLFDCHLGRFGDIALTPIAATADDKVRIQIGSSMSPWLDYDISHFSFLFMTLLFIWKIVL